MVLCRSASCQEISNVRSKRGRHLSEMESIQRQRLILNRIPQSRLKYRVFNILHCRICYSGLSLNRIRQLSSITMGESLKRFFITILNAIRFKAC